VLLLAQHVLPPPKYQRGTLLFTQAARRCKINYSTAKILLRDLTPKERTFIKLLIRQKEDQEDTHDSALVRECGHAVIGPHPHRTGSQIEVVSRVAFDFFDLGYQ
jgi:hypothetical protein